MVAYINIFEHFSLLCKETFFPKKRERHGDRYIESVSDLPQLLIRIGERRMLPPESLIE